MLGATPGNETIKRILLPIVRFCIRRSVKFQEFIEIARHLYIQAAEESLIRERHEPNVSRLAITTGLQRREVTRLWREGEAIKEQPSILHKIVGQWEGDRRFRNKSGTPRPLTFKGTASEFSTLVQSVNKDLNVYTVLFELERLELVKKEKDLLVLTSDTVVSQKDINRNTSLLGSDMEDLICAVEENTFEAPPILNHHVKTHYDNVTIEALPKIRTWLLKHGAKFHKQARAFISKYDKDLQPRLKSKPGKARVALGSFSFTSEEPHLKRDG